MDNQSAHKVTRLPVSVIILTFNEEQNLDGCLRSIHGKVDEIFVVDSCSTDRTLEIAKKYGVKIYQHEFINYSAQRNWAQDNLPLNNDWVFHMDADERAEPGLLIELGQHISNIKDKTDGFLISRKSVFMGRWIKYGGHYPVYHLRVFRRNKGRCEDRLYDQHFYVNGRVKTLSGNIVDTIMSDMDTWKSRHRQWALNEAIAEITKLDSPGDSDSPAIIMGDKDGSPIEHRRSLKEKYYKLPLFLRPFLYFIYRYFFKLGFLDGKKGLMFHFTQGLWYRFLVDLKIFEIRKKTRNSGRNFKDVIFDNYGIKVN